MNPLKYIVRVSSSIPCDRSEYINHKEYSVTNFNEACRFARQCLIPGVVNVDVVTMKQGKWNEYLDRRHYVLKVYPNDRVDVVLKPNQMGALVY